MNLTKEYCVNFKKNSLFIFILFSIGIFIFSTVIKNDSLRDFCILGLIFPSISFIYYSYKKRNINKKR